MAPKKKGKKKPAAGEWSDDDVTEPTPEAPSESLPSDTPTAASAPPAAKAKKAKAKKGKGKGKAGDDWGSEDDAPAAPLEAGSDAEEAPRPPARAKQRKQASVFAMLDDEDADGGGDDGEPESEPRADTAADGDAEAPADDSVPAAADSSHQEQVPVVALLLKLWLRRGKSLSEPGSSLHGTCIHFAACLAQDGAVVVAEILGVAPHPSADRLRVCTLDVGAADPVSVVTNAADAAGGRRVFVAVSGMRSA